jgi:hypothetical protein
MRHDLAGLVGWHGEMAAGSALCSGGLLLDMRHAPNPKGRRQHAASGARPHVLPGIAVLSTAPERWAYFAGGGSRLRLFAITYQPRLWGWNQGSSAP